MAHKWSEIKTKMTPEMREHARQEALRILAEMPLQELRRARQLSQETLAKTMDMPQGNVSRLEHQTDTYVSTLRNFIEAMGGHLRIVAEFPDGAYEIQQFHDIESLFLEGFDPNAVARRKIH